MLYRHKVQAALPFQGRDLNIYLEIVLGNAKVTKVIVATKSAFLKNVVCLFWEFLGRVSEPYKPSLCMITRLLSSV